MPDNLPLDACAPLLCAGITLYSPLMHWQAGPGKSRDCWSGRVGAYGGQIWSCFRRGGHGSQPILEEMRRRQASGGKLFYATSEPEIFTKLKGHFDLIINTVSASMDWNQYLNLLKVDGSMVIVGIPERQTPIGAFSLVTGRRSLAGSSIGGIRETQEMLDFCGKHNITCDVEVIPIQKVNEAYERVLKSDVRIAL